MEETPPVTSTSLQRWIERRDDPSAAMEDLGLFLTVPARWGGYRCSPRNSLAFAWTGGDGVHFSLLALEQSDGEDVPVVMTVPMSDDPNRIVGASLREFLSLGVDTGYFVLEQLAYDGDWSRLVRETTGTFATTALADLAEHFGLRPWPDVEARLVELDRRYRDLVVVDDGPE